VGRRWRALALLTAVAAFGLAACSDDDAATTSATSGTAAAVPELPAAAELEGGRAMIGMGDGAVYELRIDGTCAIPDPASVAFRAVDGRLSVTAEATDGAGSVVISGGDQREGRIDTVTIGETGDVTLDGIVSVADDQAPNTQPFSLRANCVVGG
jgi:hypothetical protein